MISITFFFTKQDYFTVCNYFIMLNQWARTPRVIGVRS